MPSHFEKTIISNGYRKMSDSNVSFCSIVRDCQSNLNRNIPKIEKLRKYFAESEIIIYENDSKDNTKEIISNWKHKSKNVTFVSETYNNNTIPVENKNENPYFSMYRIEKMVYYRNKYLEILNSNKFERDYVIIIDLDIANFDINGIAHSFGLTDQWDVVCANGYARSPLLMKRYYDSYALVEYGRENVNQTEMSIRQNQSKWSFMKPGLPLIPVFAAYGGFAIYRYEAIKNKKYSAVRNNDIRVGAKCDHYSLCKEIRSAGFEKIFINPNMTLHYNKISYSIIKRYISNRFKDIKSKYLIK